MSKEKPVPAKTVPAKPATKTTAAAKTARVGKAKPKGQATQADELPLTSEDQLLDEALGETFPASDPIAPGTGDVSDSALESGADPVAARSDKPFHFPTTADHQSPASREERIRISAYLRAEARGFSHGSPVEDWLAAEADVDGLG